jgi:hypothetical protein
VTLHKFRSRLGYSQLDYYRNIYSNKVFNEAPVSANENKKVVTKSITDEQKVLNVVKNQSGLTAIEIASKACVPNVLAYYILNNKLNNSVYKGEDQRWYSVISSGENSDLKVKIQDFIKKQPGSKARKIASALGVEKKDVNHILYNNLKDVCISNSEFNWYLKDDLDNKKLSKKQNIYSLLEKATKEHIAVHINYKGYGRVIHPYSVNSTYCVGFCTYRNGLRTFRIDRIREATLKDSFQAENQYSNQASKKVDEAKHYRRY